jgi:hypothetical protein
MLYLLPFLICRHFCMSVRMFHFRHLLTPWSRVHLEKLTGFAANQEIPSILWNPKVHYRTHKRPPHIFFVLWVPVTTAWRVLRFRMEERPPIWRAAANTLNKQSRTADEGWSSRLGVGRGANNSSPWKTKCYVIYIYIRLSKWRRGLSTGRHFSVHPFSRVF